MWQQRIGIPMGFSCSPIWYNMYLLSYEIKFIQRLAQLGHTDLILEEKTVINDYATTTKTVYNNSFSVVFQSL